MPATDANPVARLRIRRALAKDAPNLARMVGALFEHSVACALDPFTRSHISQSLVEVAQWFRDLCRDESAMVIVAEAGGRVIGFIKGHRQAPYVASSGITEVGYLSMLWVEPAFRRHGIARLLVDEAEAAFRAQGLHHIDLHYLSGNGEARAAWDKLGYTPYRVASFKSLE